MLDFLLSIHWRQPLWFLLAFFPILLWSILSWQKRHKPNKFADKYLLPWLEVQEEKPAFHFFLSRNSAYFVAWFLFSIALAGPRIPDKSVNSQDQILMDIMLVVDLSRSMQAKDIKPSRIRRATLEVFDFISMVKNARIGVIVYAARPHLFVPLTSDLKALTFYLNDLDTLQLPTQGSDASAAMNFAKKELLAVAQDKKQIILWMTDGDIEGETVGKLESELMTINKGNIDTYILGLATEEGAAIPLFNGGWLESEGQAVISRMNLKLLQRLSEIGQRGQIKKGHFMEVTSDDTDWNKLYAQGMLKSLKFTKSEKIQQWIELFPWVLFPAVLLLIIALFPIKLFSIKLFAKNSLNSLAVILLLLFSGTLDSTLYAADNTYDNSISQGIEAYKQNKFIKAKRYFIESVLSAENNATSNVDERKNGSKARAIALHNLGNTLFQIGDYAAAAELFTDALRYAPEQKDSIKNQVLSVALFIEVEKRRKRKMNRGNFAAPDDIAPLFDLPEQLPYMLSTKAIMLLKTSLPKLPKKDLELLLEKNLHKYDLLQNDDKLTSNQQSLLLQQQKQSDMQQARLYLMDQEEQIFTNFVNPLWKRLFETEEGFPGKLKEPQTIPGVRPW